MSTYTDYDEAVVAAARRAKAIGLAYGVEHMKQYGRSVYIVRGLPRADKRFGVDLRCEVIEPEAADLAIAAHEPLIGREGEVIIHARTPDGEIACGLPLPPVSDPVLSVQYRLRHRATCQSCLASLTTTT